ncbi:hypothetical protein SRABI27_03772 [Pedobacter sp. Bi27]|uniref:hypothetical protein n=1 Tax=Pedobacter sp. Bi27 TaxID=2822351 RepID=UPI001D2D9667|nr:hypothetical protein [Pedobacter sp. Bi27]CAH0280947.1 hypothetical protein SRABI27_03772 [Pedobacter sp. Bi27]
MRKILIVDDRIQRQMEFLPGQAEDVKKIDAMPQVRNAVGDQYTKFIDDIENNNLIEILGYDLWVFHRSLLVTRKLLNKVQGLAKEHGKALILFSGGVTFSTYSQGEFPLLILNSQGFYSDRLIGFLKKFSEDADTKIIEVIYGENWQLTYLFKYRQILQGVVYPGNARETMEELESALGELDLPAVNKKIDNILLGI